MIYLYIDAPFQLNLTFLILKKYASFNTLCPFHFPSSWSAQRINLRDLNGGPFSNPMVKRRLLWWLIYHGEGMAMVFSHSDGIWMVHGNLVLSPSMYFAESTISSDGLLMVFPILILRTDGQSVTYRYEKLQNSASTSSRGRLLYIHLVVVVVVTFRHHQFYLHKTFHEGHKPDLFASSVQNQGLIRSPSAHNQCIISTSPISASLLHHQCIMSESKAHHQRTISDS